jgi:hypothetical protein
MVRVHFPFLLCEFLGAHRGKASYVCHVGSLHGSSFMSHPLTRCLLAFVCSCLLYDGVYAYVLLMHYFIIYEFILSRVR